MKPIPRMSGIIWLFCMVLLLLLYMPSGTFAQEDPGAEAGEPGSEEVTDDSQADETAEAGDEESTAEEAEETPITGEELMELLTEPVEEIVWEVNFNVPTDIQVTDRPNDEGGAFAITWAPSDTDETMTTVTDEATGVESEVPAYEYWLFHSPTGEAGTWLFYGSIPTNTSYTWEAPESFGFFLSETNKRDNRHYIYYENTYPPTGIYTFSIETVMPEDEAELARMDPSAPKEIIIRALVYDPELTDYSSVRVFCSLGGLGGEKTELTYVPSEPVDGVEPLPWENVFEGRTSIVTTGLLVTTPKYIPFTATNIGGKRRTTLAVQPMEAGEHIVVNGDSTESYVPDNRDKHNFRLYVVPTGYVLPEGTELPPDDWMIGSAENMIASPNLWRVDRNNLFLGAIFICAAVMMYLGRARGGAALFIRRIAGLDHVEEAIGRATEMGRPILYVTGLGYMSDIATIASVNILGQVARKVADYESRLLVPQRDPIVMAVCQEVVQESYLDAGRPDAYRKDDIFFLTDDQFAYTAAVDGIMMRDKPATNFFMGMFYAESLLLAETGASTGAIQIAGTDALAQLPFFITACDYTLIGEELYAASAYLSREPMLLGSLKGQDLAKLVFMVLTLIGTILLCFSVDFIQQLFQAF